MNSTILLSAPVEAKDFIGSFVSHRSYRPFQVLFGFDVQLQLFAEAARGAGRRVLFLPAPENFFMSQSFRRLLELAGIPDEDPSRLVHARFGPVRTARVVKGAVNICAIAEDPPDASVNIGRHPFARGDLLPASVDSVLVYGPTRRPWRTVSGRSLEAAVAPDALVLGDLGAARADPVFDDDDGLPADVAIPSSLQVQSLGEFDPAQWARNAEPRGHAPSIDFRRVLIDRQLRRHGAHGTGALVLVPWNLAHPGSVIPDLMLKLARFCGPEGLTCRPVLFPYNLTTTSGQVLADVAARLRAAFDASKLTSAGLLIARLTSARELGQLPALFPFAWVDCGDPEWAWTLRRLRGVGIGAALIHSPELSPPADLVPGDLAVPADDDMRLETRDAFGRVLHWAHTLSVRGMSALMDRTTEAVGRRRAGHGIARAMTPSAESPPGPAFFAALHAKVPALVSAAE